MSGARSRFSHGAMTNLSEPEPTMSMAQSTYIRGQLYRLAQTDPQAAQAIRTELNALPRPISRAQARAFAERLLVLRETRG